MFRLIVTIYFLLVMNYGPLKGCLLNLLAEILELNIFHIINPPNFG